MSKIAVLDYRIQREAQEQIQALASNEVLFPTERCKEVEQVTKTGDADIVLVSPWETIDFAYLNACPNLRYIGLCGTSTANVDLEEVARRGIAFSNIVSGDKESVAEFFFMQLVSLVRGTGTYQWKAGETHELMGRRIGIVGLGLVGQAIAHMALAYKMKVTYYSPHRKPEWEDRGAEYVTMSDLISLSEIIVLCGPTNVEVLGEAEFKLMKPGSILVQACAGSPFDASVFLEWIAQDGNYAIFEMSAGEKNYLRYKDVPRVIFSEEVAGVTYESNQRRGQRIVQNLNEFIKESELNDHESLFV